MGENSAYGGENAAVRREYVKKGSRSWVNFSEAADVTAKRRGPESSIQLKRNCAQKSYQNKLKANGSLAVFASPDP